jgi:uncharacterized membrane protein YkvA (DUF1232 family)
MIDPRTKTGSLLRRVRRRSKKLKRQLWALALALKDPETPLLARVLILCAVGYAASPIDLIPDFIPVLGQLDDLLIVPLLIALAMRRIPREVAARSRREAYRRSRSGARLRSPAALFASGLFLLVWLALIAWLGLSLLRMIGGRGAR